MAIKENLRGPRNKSDLGHSQQPKRFVDEATIKDIIITKEGINNSLIPIRKNTSFMTKVKTRNDIIKKKIENRDVKRVKK